MQMNVVVGRKRRRIRRILVRGNERIIGMGEGRWNGISKQPSGVACKLIARYQELFTWKKVESECGRACKLCKYVGRWFGRQGGFMINTYNMYITLMACGVLAGEIGSGMYHSHSPERDRVMGRVIITLDVYVNRRVFPQ